MANEYRRIGDIKHYTVICDRCGHRVEYTHGGDVSLDDQPGLSGWGELPITQPLLPGRHDEHGRPEPLALCPDCVTALRKWLRYARGSALSALSIYRGSRWYNTDLQRFLDTSVGSISAT
jgi:hypothetical protein